MEYLFIYGTLLTDIKNPISLLLKENSEHISDGYFYGKLYNVSWYPGAIVSGDNKNKVFGTVLKLYDVANTIKILDDYEGIGMDYPIPHEYIRAELTVFTSKTEEQKCWVYLYNHSVEGLESIKSGNYLTYLETK